MLILARTFLLFPSAIKQFVEDYRNILGGQDLGTILQRISDFNDLIHRKLLIFPLYHMVVRVVDVNMYNL